MTVLKVVPESQPAPMPDQLPVPAMVMRENVTYTDKDTGAVIPFSQIQENSKKIDSLKELRWQGKKVYKAAKRATR